MVSIIRKSNDRQSEVIFKREENIKTDSLNWITTTIDELRHMERERFWIVLEEIRRYRQKCLIDFDVSVK